jgi:multidrug transporter EmrE-like cation transporter
MVAVAALFACAGPLDKVGLRFASVGFHSLSVALVAGAVVGVYALRREPAGALRRARGELRWVIAAAVVMAIAQVTQLAAIQVLQVSLVESLKRGIGMSMAVVVGRVSFAEPITAGKVVALALMLGGALVLLLFG